MLASTVLLGLPTATALATCNSTQTGVENCIDGPTPPSLVYLLTVEATETPPMIIGNGGHGNRLVIPITGGTFSGPKLQGKVLAGGGDWGSYDTANKVFAPDAKIVLETADGANILVSGRGKSPWATIEFETGSEEYSWLNDAIGVGLIRVGENNLTAEIFQVA
ncbi:hypothetical protein F5B19DRAFT_497706 [Rostrohypoxylon terebratum]|nr:hypothetical protein F5B19DRAFT_497706 [Rostrohypoxylon terebratum]